MQGEIQAFSVSAFQASAFAVANMPMRNQAAAVRIKTGLPLNSFESRR
jgi:hypothetical protein